jgi:hypothetical protein
MKFKLDSPQVSNKGLLSYEDDILTIGSCFSDEIGERLAHIDMKVNVNPTGVLFSALAIQKVLKDSMKTTLNMDHVLQRESHYLHYDFHSSVSGVSQADLTLKIKAIQKQVFDALTNGNTLMITLGTAWAYRLKESKQFVANCHKMPKQLFEKELLNTFDLFDSWQELIKVINELNPKLKILFTVSPVRHSKDGLRENNLSKGVLHQLVWDLEQAFENVHYFPAYEIVIDELRDYRFFNEDLVHPSKLGCDYVFEQFCQAYFDAENLALKQVAEKIKKAENHKHLHSSSAELQRHEQFIQDLKAEFKKSIK